MTAPHRLRVFSSRPHSAANEIITNSFSHIVALEWITKFKILPILRYKKECRVGPLFDCGKSPTRSNLQTENFTAGVFMCMMMMEVIVRWRTDGCSRRRI